VTPDHLVQCLDEFWIRNGDGFTARSRSANAALLQWRVALAHLANTPGDRLIGVGLWFSRDSLRALPLAQPILLATVVALLIAMMTGAPAILVVGLVYITTIAGIAADLQRKAGQVVATMAPLGQLTYSIYMWPTLFILVLLNALGDKLLHGGLGSMVPLAFITYGLIMAWGYFSFAFIETPARRWVDRLSLFGRRAARPIATHPTLTP
jgi:peptidoglycan/LPS O-acetylase OafA/YrhL